MRVVMRKKLDEQKETLAVLKDKISGALAGIDVLFHSAHDAEAGIPEFERKPFVLLFSAVINAVAQDLAVLEKDVKSCERIRKVLSSEPDSISLINKLSAFCDGFSFEDNLEAAIADVLMLKGDFLYGDVSSLASDETFVYYVRHAARLWTFGGSLIGDYLNLLLALNEESNSLLRLHPDSMKLKSSENPFLLKGSKISERTIQHIREKALAFDPFRTERVFRYIDGKFYPTTLSSIRSADMFYGYGAARNFFKKYFQEFSEGLSNPPLLITSLPGLGKTHFSIAHTLFYDNLTLILPEPSDLEKNLEGLIRKLAARKGHRFILFFDDVNTDKIDWYYFRTNIGGTFALPENIGVLIASNFEFPANILSRGRGFVFPMFDEIRCQEMIHDYLLAKGVRKPPTELVSVMASDYVEEFGQKVFEELSPRTLVRYLEKYEKDPQKRKRMLELASQNVTARPDAQLFFETNVKLMRALYGEDAIEELRKRQTGG